MEMCSISTICSPLVMIKPLLLLHLEENSASSPRHENFHFCVYLSEFQLSPSRKTTFSPAKKQDSSPTVTILYERRTTSRFASSIFYERRYFSLCFSSTKKLLREFFRTTLLPYRGATFREKSYVFFKYLTPVVASRYRLTLNNTRSLATG